jgi:hypothetical protein
MKRSKSKIGIILSIVLGLSLMLATGMAITADARGPKASIDMFNLCTLDGDIFTVNTEVVDTSDDTSDMTASVTMKTIQVQQQLGGWEDLGDPREVSNPQFPEDEDFNLCQLGLDPDAKAVRVVVTLEVPNSKKGTFTGRCDDDPYTEADESAIDLMQPVCQ